MNINVDELSHKVSTSCLTICRRVVSKNVSTRCPIRSTVKQNVDKINSYSRSHAAGFFIAPIVVMYTHIYRSCEVVSTLTLKAPIVIRSSAFVACSICLTVSSTNSINPDQTIGAHTVCIYTCTYNSNDNKYIQQTTDKSRRHFCCRFNVCGCRVIMLLQCNTLNEKKNKKKKYLSKLMFFFGFDSPTKHKFY